MGAVEFKQRWKSESISKNLCFKNIAEAPLERERGRRSGEEGGEQGKDVGAEKIFFGSAINLERELLTKLQICSPTLKGFGSLQDF